MKTLKTIEHAQIEIITLIIRVPDRGVVRIPQV